MSENQEKAKIYSFEEARRKREEKPQPAKPSPAPRGPESADVRLELATLLDQLAAELRTHFDELRQSLRRVQSLDMLRAAAVQADSLMELAQARIHHAASEVLVRPELGDIHDEIELLQNRSRMLRLDQYFSDTAAGALTTEQLTKYLADAEAFSEQF